MPIFEGLTHYANPALANAQVDAPVTVTADPATCSFQFNPVGTAQFTSSCDIAKSFLARNSVNYRNIQNDKKNFNISQIYTSIWMPY
jgi:hypothetical protein